MLVQQFNGPDATDVNPSGTVSTPAPKRKKKKDETVTDTNTATETNIVTLISQHKDEVALFNELQSYAEAPEWIPYLPVPNTYKHPNYGDVIITPERNAHFVENFKAGVYQEQIPVDLEHQTKLSGAAGWIKDFRQNADGAVEARVEWTDRGKSAFADTRFKYFSPEWYDTWEDPISKTVHSDIAIGGALTTRPFFKERALKPLVASEQGLFFSDNTENQPVINFFSMKEAAPVQATIFWTTGATGTVVTSNTTNGVGIVQMATNKNVNPNDDQDADDDPTDAPDPKSSDFPKKGGKKMTEPVQMTEEVARMFAEMKDELKSFKEREVALVERAAALETNLRLKKFTDLVMGKTEESPRWFGEPDTHVKTLDHIAKTAGEESDVFTAFVANNVAIANQVKSANLFKEVGNGSQGSANESTTSASKLSVIASEIRQKNPSMTPAMAFAEAATKNPELYAEYDKDFKMQTGQIK